MPCVGSYWLIEVTNLGRLFKPYILPILPIPERTFGLTLGSEASALTRNASETTPSTASAKSRPPAGAGEKIPTRPQPRASLGECRWAEPSHA